MNHFDWKALLTQWSEELHASGLNLSEGEYSDVGFSKEVRTSPAAIPSGWLGYPGATEAQIVQAENRLGVHLPPSYREFLKVTNGWPRITDFIYKIWPVEEIDWFATRHQDLIDIWMEGDFHIPDQEYFVYGEAQGPTRVYYLQTALEISDKGDQAFYLLNPQVITPEGEWEAWFFAEWLHGAVRYPSFWELMQGEHQSFLRGR